MPDGDSATGRASAGRRQRHRHRHAARAASGTCTRCGKRAPEPGLKVCRLCGEKRRAAEKARRAKARAEGRIYAGRDPEATRRAARAGDRRRRRARKDEGLCTSCGRNRPADGRSICEPCRDVQRTIERERYAACKLAGACVRCKQPTVGESSRCGRCAVLEAERTPPERRRAFSRKRYARRKARGLCVDCAVPAAGSARCPRCAYRSNVRAPARHAMLAWPPQITVIDPDAGEIGTFETEAEAAASLVFAGLRPDQVEIRADIPLMALGAE